MQVWVSCIHRLGWLFFAKVILQGLYTGVRVQQRIIDVFVGAWPACLSSASMVSFVLTLPAQTCSASMTRAKQCMTIHTCMVVP